MLTCLHDIILKCTRSRVWRGPRLAATIALAQSSPTIRCSRRTVRRPRRTVIAHPTLTRHEPPPTRRSPAAAARSTRLLVIKTGNQIIVAGTEQWAKHTHTHASDVLTTCEITTATVCSSYLTWFPTNKCEALAISGRLWWIVEDSCC